MAASAPTRQGVAPPWHAGPAHVTPFFVVSRETPGGLVVGASPEGGGDGEGNDGGGAPPLRQVAD
jgi:hypothetical protein